LIIDNEIVGMVKRFLQGIEDYGSPFASEILKDYGDKEELLSHPSTLKYFRKELFFPSTIIDRMTRDSWKAKGSKSARKRAKDLSSQLLEKPSIKPIDDTLANELDKIAEKALR